jgi:hypothetical protein
MSRAKRQRDFSSDQGELFAQMEEPPVVHRANAPDLTIAAELRGSIDAAMRRAKARGISRDRIADRMNLALPGIDRLITKRQVDSWMADSKEFHRLPAEWLPAFCWAVEDEGAAKVIVHALGNEMVDAREVAAKALGDAHVQIAALRRKVGELTRRLSA